MEKKDYTTLDQEIILAISKGKNRFTQIFDRCPAADGRGRDVDRRLQALRKQGKIDYQARGIGWQLTTKRKSS